MVCSCVYLWLNYLIVHILYAHSRKHATFLVCWAIAWCIPRLCCNRSFWLKCWVLTCLAQSWDVILHQRLLVTEACWCQIGLITSHALSHADGGDSVLAIDHVKQTVQWCMFERGLWLPGVVHVWMVLTRRESNPQETGSLQTAPLSPAPELQLGCGLININCLFFDINGAIVLVMQVMNTRMISLHHHSGLVRLVL